MSWTTMPPLAARLRRPLSAVFLLAALCASGAARAKLAQFVECTQRLAK